MNDEAKVPTFAEFAPGVLDERERQGKLKGHMQRERSRFRNHLARAAFANKALTDISTADIEAWLSEMAAKEALDKRGKRPLKSETIKRSWALLSEILTAAGPEQAGLIATNPCHQIRLSKALQGRDEAKEYDYLTVDEQDAIANSPDVADTDRLPILFAIGTGLSFGEQFHLKLADLHLDAKRPHVTVRVGHGGLQRTERTVPLLGPALKAARQWEKLLPLFAPHNPQRLLFPNSSGKLRTEGKALGRSSRLREVLNLAGVHYVPWRDFRHTCSVSMASGWWDRAYSLDEIQQMLGHSNIAQTSRYYAKFIKSTLTSDGERRSTSSRRASNDDAGASAPQVEKASPAEQETDQSELPEPARWRDNDVLLDEASVTPFTTDLALPKETLARVTAALSIGKHLLLVGPPGTGKTELAHALVDAATGAGYCAGAHVATASADWTTFDTIGGYAVERTGNLRFRPGALLRALEAYEWFIIDELNRADVDRAFGELMTVLAGRTVDTQYRLESGDHVRVGPELGVSHQMPPTFRVIATMNTWDKTSLFRLSYAVQRRFAIVNIGVPADAAYARLLVTHAKRSGAEPTSDPSLDDATCDVLSTLFSTNGIQSAREIGPAIALDVVRYVRRRLAGSDLKVGDALAEALTILLLPQLEGLKQDRAVKALRAITSALKSTECTPEAIAETRERLADLLPHVVFRDEVE